jgi:hypothetical protein
VVSSEAHSVPETPSSSAVDVWRFRNCGEQPAHIDNHCALTGCAQSDKSLPVSKYETSVRIPLRAVASWKVKIHGSRAAGSFVVYMGRRLDVSFHMAGGRAMHAAIKRCDATGVQHGAQEWAK